MHKLGNSKSWRGIKIKLFVVAKTKHAALFFFKPKGFTDIIDFVPIENWNSFSVLGVEN
jgi:hypothetical protein